MSKKLDPEGLGIILLNAFMDEFFPEEKRSTPDTFDLLHYNGIPRSNVDDKVRKLITYHDELFITFVVVVVVVAGEISSWSCCTVGE